MKKSSNILLGLYIVGSLVAIAVLSILLVDARKKKEGLCLCHGMKTEICQNRDLITQLYRDGQLTEYTDLGKIQEMEGGPRWSLSNYSN